MLPRVKIIFENGLLGSSSPMDDGVCGFICTGEENPGMLDLHTPYLITKYEALEDFGVTSDEHDPNAILHKAVKEFYDIAPRGSKLYFMCVEYSMPLYSMLDKNEPLGRKLIEYSNGSIRALFAFGGHNHGHLDGLSADVYEAAINGQQLAEWAADEKFAPCFIVVEGKDFNGTPADLAELHEGELNRVGILIGDTVEYSERAAIGLLAGTIANIPVQRSIARVRNGALPVKQVFIADRKVEDADVEVISDKGFITFRTFTGKSGYYFTDDKLATKISDDYALIPRRRVIDKAYRIAYITLLEELNDELPVDDEGRIPAPITKNIQNNVERAIINNMTAYRNLGNDPSDPNDTGVECYIDPNQNIVATSKLDVRLRVKPYAYPKYIDCYLGFKAG